MTLKLKGGVARANISPPVRIEHTNWGAQTHQLAHGIDMDLTATAVVLAESKKKIVFIAIDLVYVDDELFEEIAKKINHLTGIGKNRICISASHTHSGPAIYSNRSWAEEGAETAREYRKILPEKIAGAVWEAYNNMVPVRVGIGFGECAINVNRRFNVPENAKKSNGQIWKGNRNVVGRNWGGATDREVGVIRIDDKDENPLAILVNYAAHGTSVAFQHKKITPDYPGPMRKIVEEITGATCLFFQGAAGNQGTIRDFASDLNVYHILGTILGCEVAKVALTIDTLSKEEKFKYVLESGADLAIYDEANKEEPDNSLDIINTVVKLPVKKVNESDKAGLEKRIMELKSGLKAKREHGSEEEVRNIVMTIKREMKILNRIKLLSGRDLLEVNIQGIRIGNIVFIIAPFEMFAEIGKKIKRNSPFKNTIIIGYANGTKGYLPTSAAYSKGGYEVGTCYFRSGADIVFQNACQEILQELNERINNKC